MTNPQPWTPPACLTPPAEQPAESLPFTGSESAVEAALKSAHNATVAARQQRSA